MPITAVSPACCVVSQKSSNFNYQSHSLAVLHELVSEAAERTGLIAHCPLNRRSQRRASDYLTSRVNSQLSGFGTIGSALMDGRTEGQRERGEAEREREPQSIKLTL